MRPYDKYFIDQPDFRDMYNDGAIIVPDTNFLLMAYQSRHVTIDEVKKVLEELNRQKRLKIPEQVLYEFSKNRQIVILEQIALIDNEINKSDSDRPKKEMKIFMPAAETSSEIIKAQEKSEILSKALKEYKDSLKEVRKKIVGQIDHDDYFEFIKTLCQDSFSPYSRSKDLLREEGLRRISLGIKPGTNENKFDPTGDYIIWSEIMALKKNVIFVSNDQKKDWIFKNKNNQPMGVDQTLLSEFYSETDGKCFVHVTPKEFIKFLVPELEKAVEEDLDKANDDILSYAISSNRINFGDNPGDVTDYWEIGLNRKPTAEDSLAIREIFESEGTTNTPIVLMYDPDNYKYKIIVDLSGRSSFVLRHSTIEKLQKHFGEDITSLRFKPRLENSYIFI
ncbi:hypothetical protein COJ38_22035 [Bacillus cereus]|uniref:PIN-like domain-containing protein n=1 Tax=Bacillus cereus TaxID=1396 RepID=UPI000BF7F0DC|nr:PIN-like domain-containing protein [Bacillus cereus]MEB9862201.1 PIN domain-containing protein [Bacillus cereus]PFC07290.1 hypothetical protein CN280_08825 [Bacillus cereus]PFL86199.1 hypothetical protein COJ38_22035 [Bacillus cereus]PFN79026.1 hypothetical protein COJ64_04415 [Bacillus cereus]PFU74457.1 hypothetical protein COK94_15875 [Bacillus cereus]